MRIAFIIANLPRLFLEVELRHQGIYPARMLSNMPYWLLVCLLAFLTPCACMDSTDDDGRARNKCVRVKIDCASTVAAPASAAAAFAVQLHSNEGGFEFELNRGAG